jgi:hypothetical protein
VKARDLVRTREVTRYLVRYAEGRFPVELELADEGEAVALAAHAHGTVDRLYVAVTATERLADYRQAGGHRP